jgi:hypothetical protein
MRDPVELSKAKNEHDGHDGVTRMKLKVDFQIEFLVGNF